MEQQGKHIRPLSLEDLIRGRLEYVRGQICDQVCKHAEEHKNDEDEDALFEICETCPLALL